MLYEVQCICLLDTAPEVLNEHERICPFL